MKIKIDINYILNYSLPVISWCKIIFNIGDKFLSKPSISLLFDEQIDLIRTPYVSNK
jgi:hypothetical protein